MNDCNCFYEVNMRNLRIEYMTRFADDKVAWTTTVVEVPTMREFFEYFNNVYGRWHDSVLAYRIDGKYINYPDDQKEFIENNEYVQDMIKFFFNNDIEAGKRARKARM